MPERRPTVADAGAGTKELCRQLIVCWSCARSIGERGGTTIVARRPCWLLMASLALCAACVQNPRVEPSEQLPPIVARQRVLSADEGDPLLRAALEEYNNDAAVRELVDAVRSYSSAPLMSGNAVSALIDGPQTYASIESDLQQARHHIHIETFIFGADDIGRRFARLLADKRTEGVAVRVLYDSIGSMDTPKSFFDELRGQGIEVREFRPINPLQSLRLWNIHNRDHRKIIVVDGEVGFTGGINIDSTYSSASTSRPGPKRGMKDGAQFLNYYAPWKAQTVQEVYSLWWKRFFWAIWRATPIVRPASAPIIPAPDGMNGPMP